MAPDNDGIQFLSEFFKDKKDGYLIDVGAHDGVKDGSMTRFLMEQGWKGMLIEPLPEAFIKLKEAYKDWEGVITLPFACSDENGEAELYPFRGVTTMDPAWRDACAAWWKHVKYGKPIIVTKRTLKNLLSLHGAPNHIDLLQIDTEGHDLQVLKGMDWDRRPSMVIAESLDMRHPERKLKNGYWKPDPELVSYMNQVGYSLVKLTKGGNVFFLPRGTL